MKIGQTIERLRRERNWSQGDLSALMGEPRQMISGWEKGTAVPEMDRLIHLSRIFEMTPEELVGEERYLLGREKIKPPIKDRGRSPLAVLGIRLLILGLLIALSIGVHVVWFRWLTWMAGR